ncbi:MAG: hypothetical protein WKG07_08005 [Hymenobacter sp.]
MKLAGQVQVVVDNAREALVFILRQVAIGIVEIFLAELDAAFLEVARQGGGRENSTLYR